MISKFFIEDFLKDETHLFTHARTNIYVNAISIVIFHEKCVLYGKGRKNFNFAQGHFCNWKFIFFHLRLIL